MAGITNKGKLRFLTQSFNSGTGASTDYTYRIHLVTDGVTPTAGTNELQDLVQCSSGNGYLTAGYEMTSGASFFDNLVEDDVGDTGYVQAADITWTASGGPIPSNGAGARYAIICDNTSNGDDVGGSTRKILAYWDLAAARSVTDGQSFTLQDLQLTLTDN